jgi:chromosome segregation ATPase
MKIKAERGRSVKEESTQQQSTSAVVAAAVQAALQALAADERKKTPAKTDRGEQVRSFSMPALGLGDDKDEEEETDVKGLAATVKQLLQKQAESEKQMTALNNLVTTLQNQNNFVCQDLDAARRDVDAARRDVDALQHEVASLKDKNAILCQDNQLLRKDPAKVQGDASKIQGDVTKVTSDVGQIQTDSAKFKSDVGQIQADVTQVKADYQADIAKAQGQLQTELKELRADHAKLQAMAQKQSQQVAFQAWRKEAMTINFFDPVAFNEVDLNKGDAYNPQTGFFTAPVAGLYCFVVTTHGGEENITWVTWLDVEGTLVSVMGAQGKTCLTNHTAAHINAGEKVQVKAARQDGFPLSVGNGVFTGFLVQPDP